MDGLLTCARYAFSPNQLGYCGPDKNNTLLGYVSMNQQDIGLKEILTDFQTLKPYLDFIARSNAIPDSFDQLVTEAYWLGNGLLEQIDINRFYRYLNEDLALSKKLSRKNLEYLYGKLPLGARPHHSFHVLNIWKRTGFLAIEHTLETMDNCCVNWGRVIGLKPGIITVQYHPLILQKGKLKKGGFIKKDVQTQTNGQNLYNEFIIGDIATFHWGSVCEKINVQKAKQLDYYTNQAIALANLTI